MNYGHELPGNGRIHGGMNRGEGGSVSQHGRQDERGRFLSGVAVSKRSNSSSSSRAFRLEPLLLLGGVAGGLPAGSVEASLSDCPRADWIW